MGPHGQHVKSHTTVRRSRAFSAFHATPEVPAPLRRPNQDIRSVWLFGAPSGTLLLCGFEFIGAAGNLCDDSVLTLAHEQETLNDNRKTIIFQGLKH